MNLLLDSNTIIYLETPQYHHQIKNLIRNEMCYASSISVPEVLGYSDLLPQQKSFFESFFAKVSIYSVDNTIIWEAARLRQIRKLSLGDAIIAATVIVHDLTLVTANTKDFKKFGLTLINPLDLT